MAELGVSFSQISLLFLMYPISSLVFEIPTGVADLYGRKTAVSLSYLLTGLPFTFETDTLDAWLVDTVEYKSRSEHLHRLLGRLG